MCMDGTLYEALPKCIRHPTASWRTVAVFGVASLFSLFVVLHVCLEAATHIRASQIHYNEQKAIRDSPFCNGTSVSGTPNSKQAEICKEAELVYQQNRLLIAVQIVVFDLIDHITGQCWLPAFAKPLLLAFIACSVAFTALMWLTKMPGITLTFLTEAVRDHRLRRAQATGGNDHPHDV